MADEALKFQVNLGGNLTSELVASGKAATTAEGNIQALTGAILALTEASKPKQAEGGFFTFDLAKGAEMAIGFVKSLASEVVNLGSKIVTAAASKQDLDVALRSNAGVEGAKRINDVVAGFKDTRFGGGKLKQELLPLLETGLTDPEELRLILTAATDVAARKNDAGAISTVIGAFERIHVEREVNKRALRAVGVNETDFYTALGETIGRSAKEAEVAVKAGKVKADVLEHELLAQIAKKEGGSLGVATDESAKTIGTTLERLERIPAQIFARTADSPGLKALQDRTDQFIDKLAGPAGDRVVAAMGTAIDTIGKKLVGDGDAIDKLVDTISNGIPKAADAIMALVGAISRLAPVLNAIAPAARAIAVTVSGDARMNAVKEAHDEQAARDARVAALGGGLTGRWKFMMEELGISKPGATEAGRDVAAGLAEGMASGAPIVSEAASGLAASAVGGVDDKLQIHSPSRVMIERGEMSGEGMAIGLDNSASRVSSAARQSLADSIIGGTPRGLGGGASIAPTIIFQLAPGTTEEQVRGAAEIFRAELSQMLDEAQGRFGGSP